MDLSEEPEAYASVIRSSTISYTATVGVVVAVILTITGIIAFTVLRGGELLFSVIDAVTYVFVPLIILAAVYSYIRASRAYRDAIKFHELARTIAGELGVKNGELLEKPAPPYSVIYRRFRRYIVVRKEDGVTVINVLQPEEVSHEESYAPIYMWKTRELIMYKDIDGYRAALLRLWALFPDPKTRMIIHGEFTAYSLRVPSREEIIIDAVKKLIEKTQPATPTGVK